MLVTIAINNYNYGDYIKDAIDSILNQIYDNIEVIVVDDGSTDHSRDVISSYGDKIIPVFQKNAGQTSAMNKGWELAKGEIVMFVDADDVLRPDAIKRCVEIYESGDYINVYFLMEKVDKNLKSKGDVTPDQGYSDRTPLEDMKLWGYYAAPPTSAQTFRKSFLDKIMPAPELAKDEADEIIPADAYFSTHAPFYGDLYFINEVLGLYRLHGNNKGSLRNNFSLEKLHYMFMRDVKRETIQNKHYKKLNMDVEPDRVSFNPLYIKHRFLSYRIAPKQHPVPSDTFWYLLKRSIQAPLTYPYFGAKQKTKSLIAGLAIAFLPRAAIIYVLNKYYINSYRSDADKL